ncbi:MAG TPA: hypothetical protein VHE30_08600 [Polyangiaceae bacterium]|nr:hypothetical protein [Polyangiaceae bacterium]
MKHVLRRALGPAPALFAFLSVSCGQQAQTVTLRSLDASADVSFLCLGLRGNESYPRSLDQCPDLDPTDSDEARHLMALVTQPNRGEVAVVDITGARVVDEEPSVPGSNFLPVGANPGSIVSTPGGVATFVGVSRPGREGIFALPSSCILTRLSVEPTRDITTWSACRLPSAPDAMAVLLDSNDVPCTGAVTSEDVQDGRECPAKLSTEVTPGRRVLAVSLPDRGGIALIDAQDLLNRPPGEYQPCAIDRWVPLRADAREPNLKENVEKAGLVETDRFPGLPHEDDPAPSSRPSGFAKLDDPVTGEHRLFVADHEASVIHDLDTSDVCAMADTKAPLRPMSFLDPNRFVTTSRVAVSPLTTTGSRYLYAIDDLDTGSVMTFDVSPGSTDRAPLLRKRAKWTPREPPDRIKFDAPISDITFGLRDRPALDPVSGTSTVGVLCNPAATGVPQDPLNDVAIQSQYWPKPDYSAGAAASNLRGIFAFAALSTGTVAVIDVEDFDEACRRPGARNFGTAEDFRGCAPESEDDERDYPASSFPVPPDPNTRVTNELSCEIVEPHRPRSATLALNDSDRGNRAPALRTRPKLIDVTGRSLGVDTTDEGKKHPHLLGVNFGPAANEHAAVYIGTTLFETTSADNPLVIDPAKANESSLVLSFAEPRSYVPQSGAAAVYEGKLIDQRLAARYQYNGPGVPATFTDAGNLFCGAGIEDVPNARLRGASLGVTEQADLDTFATQHADTVVITSELLDENDAYWTKGSGAKCGSDLPGATATGFVECGAVLGTGTKPSQYRELRITKATVGTLEVEPKAAPTGTELSDRLANFVECCFPTVVAYEVRATNEWIVAPFEHRMVASTDADRRCVPDQGQLTSLLSGGRVVEVSCDPASPRCKKNGDPIIGFARVGDPQKPATMASRDVACVVEDPSSDTQTIGTSPFTQCIHQGLTTRFVIYRGQQASERDMQFLWQVVGSFSPFTFPLATGSDPNSVPRRILYSNELGQVVVADGSTKGLVLVDPGSFATVQFY